MCYWTLITLRLSSGCSSPSLPPSYHLPGWKVYLLQICWHNCTLSRFLTWLFRNYLGYLGHTVKEIFYFESFWQNNIREHLLVQSWKPIRQGWIFLTFPEFSKNIISNCNLTSTSNLLHELILAICKTRWKKYFSSRYFCMTDDGHLSSTPLLKARVPNETSRTPTGQLTNHSLYSEPNFSIWFAYLDLAWVLTITDTV